MKLAVYADRGSKKTRIAVKGFKFDLDQLLQKIRVALNLPSSYQRIVYFDGSSIEHVHDNLLFTEFIHVLEVYQFLNIEIVPIYIESKSDNDFNKTQFIKSRLNDDQIDRLQMAVNEAFGTIRGSQKSLVESEVYNDNPPLPSTPNQIANQHFEQRSGRKKSLAKGILLSNSPEGQTIIFPSTQIEGRNSCEDSLILEKLPLSRQCECGHIVMGGEDYYICILCSHISCLNCQKASRHDHEMALTEMSQIEELSIFGAEVKVSESAPVETELTESTMHLSFKESMVQILSGVLSNPFNRAKKSTKQKIAC